MTDITIRGGDRYRVVRRIELAGLVHWRAPLTTGFECTITPPTVLVVAGDPMPGARAADCVGEDPTLEAMIVPDADRLSEKYAGYSLVVDLDLFGEALHAIAD